MAQRVTRRTAELAVERGPTRGQRNLIARERAADRVSFATGMLAVVAGQAHRVDVV
jgi:hypothetical protein